MCHGKHESDLRNERLCRIFCSSKPFIFYFNNNTISHNTCIHAGVYSRKIFSYPFGLFPKIYLLNLQNWNVDSVHRCLFIALMNFLVLYYLAQLYAFHKKWNSLSMWTVLLVIWSACNYNTICYNFTNAVHLTHLDASKDRETLTFDKFHMFVQSSLAFFCLLRFFFCLGWYHVAFSFSSLTSTVARDL